MNKISKNQRSTFFLIANKIGKDNAYSIMETVTGGISSLRDEKLTFEKMKRVIDELISVSGMRIKKPRKPKRYKRPLEITYGGKIIQLMTSKQKKAIFRMREKVNMNQEQYNSFCTRILRGKKEPATIKEAQAILAALKYMIGQKWIAR